MRFVERCRHPSGVQRTQIQLLGLELLNHSRSTLWRNVEGHGIEEITGACNRQAHLPGLTSEELSQSMDLSRNLPQSVGAMENCVHARHIGQKHLRIAEDC